MQLLLILGTVSALLGGLTLAFLWGVRRSASIAVKTWRTDECKRDLSGRP